MSLRSELRKAHEGSTYRVYRCTGINCDAEAVALEGLQMWCGRARCRGQMTPRRVYPLSRLIASQLARFSGL